MQKLSRFIYNKPIVLSLWFGLSFLIVLREILNHQGFNNYTIFKYNFLHTLNQQNLYAFYPEHYYDLNHYGPVFSLLFAPFTFLPDTLGILLWMLFNAFILYKAIEMLPLKDNQYLIVLLICAHELMTASANVQSNPMIAGLIILSFNFIKRKQDFWAALKFIASFIFWSAVLFVLPMLISSPSFIIQTYHDWYIDLKDKNVVNEASRMQDISVMGLLRNILHAPGIKNAFVIIPAIVLFGCSYLRVNFFKTTSFQLLILSSALIFSVIFSSGAESPTYIIAFAGVAIWFMNLDRPVTRLEIALLVFALILTSLSPSDLFPRYIRETYVMPYKLKALPCFLIWLKIMYEIFARKFKTTHLRVVTS
jgi:hypothetical protein